MNEQYYQTLKSVETEDWLDFHVIRPFCFQLARLFAKFDIHPNTVTIWSIIIGAGSSFLFASGCYYYEGGMGLFYNLAAIFLLMWADFFDCTDGQLARLTGKASPGLCPSIWPLTIVSTIITTSSSVGWVLRIRLRIP